MRYNSCKRFHILVCASRWLSGDRSILLVFYQSEILLAELAVFLLSLPLIWFHQPFLAFHLNVQIILVSWPVFRVHPCHYVGHSLTLLFWLMFHSSACIQKRLVKLSPATEEIRSCLIWITLTVIP